MPTPLDRETLKSMKRADLQRICKDFGIKANLKTEALIDLLVVTTEHPPRPNPAPPSQRTASTRIASRATTVSRLRGTSSSSVIIHDTDDEDNTLARVERGNVSPAPPSEPEVAFIPPPRTRRAKETQYKLGVGRPTTAGGNGARTLTRSTSLSQRAKRSKGSRSAKPTEAVIQEEEEPDPMQDDSPQAGPSGTTHEPSGPETQTFHIPAEPLSPLDPLPDPAALPIASPDITEQLKTYVTNLVTPLQTQVHLLQAELQQRSTQMADLSSLVVQVRSLHAEVESLRPQAALVPQLQAEVQQLRQVVSALASASAINLVGISEKSLGKSRASDEGSTQTIVGRSEASHVTAATAQTQALPGVAQSLLGKRHRGLDDSELTEMVEAGQESIHSLGKLEKRAVRPTRKRPKLSSQEETLPGPSFNAETGRAPEDPSGEVQLAPRTTFTVFQGLEEPPETYVDPPPPTTHLSDLFPFGTVSGETTPPNGAIPRPPGADENAPNQMHPNFNFAFSESLFHPVTSTPFDRALPAFTYPEAPTSPSPAAPSGGFIERAGGRIERNDLFQPLRQPSQALAQSRPLSQPQAATERPASRASPSSPSQPRPQSTTSTTVSGGGGTINPSALMAAPELHSGPETPQEEDASATAAMSNHSGIFSLPQRTVSSTEVGMQLGMSSMLPLPPDTPGATMKRTMYGTELEGDTRFGDFGVEGVASGFWAGLARRK